MTDGDGRAETSIDTLLAGAKVTFTNAEQLYLEAKVLAGVGAKARALCLHQISLEECAKVEKLGAWAVSLVLGHDVDKKKALTALGHHAAKNKQNAYMLEPSQDEKDARKRGDMKAALEAFQKTQVEFHAKSNGAKNASLYVDWQDGAFVAPADRITEEMLQETAARNETFLGYAQNGVNSLIRLAANPDTLKELLAEFVEQAENLRASKQANPFEAMEELTSRFMEAGKARLKP